MVIEVFIDWLFYCYKICLVEKKGVLYLELAHGGHLGFYEGGLIYPNTVTWLDRTLVSLIGGLALNYHDSLMKPNSNTQLL